MADIHISIVVTDADVEIPRTIGATLAPLTGTQEFRCPLRPKGATGPATHWMTSGWLGEQFVQLVESPEALHAVCQQVGLPYTLEHLQGVKDRAVVRLVNEISAIALLDELNLERIEEPV